MAKITFYTEIALRVVGNVQVPRLAVANLSVRSRFFFTMQEIKFSSLLLFLNKNTSNYPVLPIDVRFIKLVKTESLTSRLPGGNRTQSAEI